MRIVPVGHLALLLPVLLARAAFGQAEPAPEDYIPPGHTAPLEPGPAPAEPGATSPEAPGALPATGGLPKWHIAVAPRLVVRLGAGPVGLPVVGYGGGVSIARSLLSLGRRLRFGVGFDFAYDRLNRDQAPPATGSQFLSHASFAAMGVFDAFFGRVRPWLGIGGGLSVAAYQSAPSASNNLGESAVSAAGLIHFALGLGVRLWESFELGLRGEFDLTISSTTVGTPPVQVFQPGLFALSLDLGFRF